MGLISGAIDAALESIGKSLLDVGEWFLKTGYTLWTNAGKVTLDYVKISPMAQSGAWGVVTGSVYQTSLAVAASLAVLFFVMGWLRESIDIRNNFTLENMFRFFVRYAITASLIVNSLSLLAVLQTTLNDDTSGSIGILQSHVLFIPSLRFHVGLDILVLYVLLRQMIVSDGSL